MNADLTINSIVFANNYNDNGESKRSSSARGVNLKDVLVIRNQDSVEKQTGIESRRYTMRVDANQVDTVSGKPYVVSIYAVFSIPKLATQAQIDAVVATFRAAIASTTPNYITQILNDEK